MDNKNIGIAVVVENSTSKKILLIEEEVTKTESNKNLGELSLVVGHVRVGESPLEAATREIEEETGIIGLVPNRLVSIFYFRKGHIVFLFSCEVNEETNKVGKWYSRSDIKGINNLRSGVKEAIDEYTKRGSVSSDFILVN